MKKLVFSGILFISFLSLVACDNTESEAEKVVTEGSDRAKDATQRAEAFKGLEYMSKALVKEQLISEGFSEQESEYAVNNLKDIDFKKRALNKARWYLDNPIPYDIFDQLAKEKFTKEEINYAKANYQK